MFTPLRPQKPHHQNQPHYLSIIQRPASSLPLLQFLSIGQGAFSPNALRKEHPLFRRPHVPTRLYPECKAHSSLKSFTTLELELIDTQTSRFQGVVFPRTVSMELQARDELGDAQAQLGEDHQFFGWETGVSLGVGGEGCERAVGGMSKYRSGFVAQLRCVDEQKYPTQIN